MRFVTAAIVTTEMFVVPRVIIEGGPPVKEGVTVAVALERGYGAVEGIVWLA